MQTHQLLCLLEGRSDILRLDYTDRFTSQPFDHLDVIDTVFAPFRVVDVFIGQLDAVIHIETALRLADQPQVGVVDHHVDIRQLELRANGQLFDHELEVVVTRQRDHFALRIGGTHAQSRRKSPA
ncbi:hypothetical protein D3C75_1102460 [compost metagenome]